MCSVFVPLSVKENCRYSPLEVRNPKKTTIVVVTAAIRSPSMFSLSLIRSLHNKKVPTKKITQQIHYSHCVFPALSLYRPRKAVGGDNSPVSSLCPKLLLATTPLLVDSVVTVLAGSAWRLCNTQSQGTKGGRGEGRPYLSWWGSPSSPDPPHLS